MRQSNIDRDWRRASSLTSGLSKFSYSGVRGLQDRELYFSFFANAFVGANGTGKSTLLSLLRLTMDPTINAVPGDLLARVLGATFRLECVGYGAVTPTLELTMEVDEQGLIQRTSSSAIVPPDCIYVDAAHHARRLKALLGDASVTAELLESVEGSVLDDGDVDQISWLVGKRYERIELFEVPLAVVADGSVPTAERTVIYPRATEFAGASYGADAMGLGELCMILLFQTMKRAPQKSILLLEEPETSLSRESERHLGSFLAHVGMHGPSIVLSTHSDLLIERLPTKALILCYRVGGVTMTKVAPNEHQLATSLGVPRQPRTALICEDGVSRRLLEAILRNRCQELMGFWYTVRVSNGASGITSATQVLPRLEHSDVIAVYDGDQKGSVHTADACQRLFLTGKAPEDWIRLQIERNATRFARALGVSKEDLNIAVAAYDGEEGHDWLERLAARFSLTFDVFLDKLILSCTKADTAAFVKNITTAIRSVDIVGKAERAAKQPKNDRVPLERAELTLIRSVAQRRTSIVWSKDLVRRAKAALEAIS